MGKRDELRDLKVRLCAAETRLEAIDGKCGGRVWYDYQSSTTLEQRLSALEAKAGEGKGCDGIPEACKRREYKCEFKSDWTMKKAGTLYIDGKKIGDCSQLEIRNGGHETSVHFTTIPDELSKPQPGDRIMSQHVPMGRWFKLDRLHEVVYGRRCSMDTSCGVTHFVRHDGTPDKTGSCVEVTLLPEDYEPGRKAESPVEYRVRPVSGGRLLITEPNGSEITVSDDTEISIGPTYWKKWKGFK